MAIQTCRSLCSKKFFITTFSRILYDLTEKWNLDIDFYKILIYCNFPKFS